LFIKLLLLPPAVAAQRSDLSAYLARHSAEVTLVNGRLGGAGADLLRQEAARAQFIFLGEEHGIAEIPQFASALWLDLTPLDYRHIALEQGPWMISQADLYVRFGDSEAMRTYRASVVPLLQYSSEESFAFFNALRPAARGAKSPVVWGLDQEMRIVPLLRRLLMLARTTASRRAIQAVIAQASSGDKPGRSNLRGYGDDISMLRRSLGLRLSSEAKQILDLMEISNRIYENNDRASKEPTGFESNREREEMMKSNFLEKYRGAQRAGEKRPRVLLQFGALHGVRGLSPTKVSSLGNFIAEFARGEGSRMFNIAVTCGKRGRRSGSGEEAGKELPCGADEAAWAQPLLKAAQWKWTLFDLRPLRPVVYAGKVEAPEPLNSIIFQYDALLIMAATTPMHFPRQ
jgi:hypothetical protein